MKKSFAFLIAVFSAFTFSTAAFAHEGHDHGNKLKAHAKNELNKADKAAAKEARHNQREAGKAAKKAEKEAKKKQKEAEKAAKQAKKAAEKAVS